MFDSNHWWDSLFVQILQEWIQFGIIGDIRIPVVKLKKIGNKISDSEPMPQAIVSIPIIYEGDIREFISSTFSKQKF